MIDFQNIDKAFGTQQILNQASFRIHPGERVGIVGPNGAGKSTIFSLLTGEITPEKGQIALPSGMRIGHMRQQLNAYLQNSTLLEYTENAVPELKTIQREIEKLEHLLDDADGEQRTKLLNRLGENQTEFEHLGGYDLKHRAEAALSGLGFSEKDFTNLFSSFSGGWQMRAELARVLIANPDILLLDEPTNFLDVPAVEWLKDYLRAYSGTMLLISHDRYLLNTLSNVTLEVAGAHVERYPGNYDNYIETRKQRYEQLAAAHRNQSQKKEQIERFVERFRSKNTKASQVQSRIKMLEKMEDVELPQEVLKPTSIKLKQPPHSGHEIIRIEKGTFSYDGTNNIFQNADLRIERGDKIAVIGPNGQGKTTLLKLLAGKLTLNSGNCINGHKVITGYQSQDFTDSMNPEFTVLATLKEKSPDTSEPDLRSLAGGFGFRGEAVEKKVKVISGGEKMRLGLAKLLVDPPNFIILDEPTTHLDIPAREALQDALKKFQGTLCFVSHDIEFVKTVAETIVTVSPEGVTKYYGDYAYYRKKLEEQEAETSQQQPQNAQTDSAESSKEDRKNRKREEAQRRQELYKLRKPLEKELAKVEKNIEKNENLQASLHEQMASGEASLDFQQLNKELHTVNTELETLTEHWEEISLQLEEINSD